MYNLCRSVLTMTLIWFQFELETVDITLPENKEWYKKYRHDIPVFHLNGQFLMKHRADLKVFHQRLADIENKTGQKMIYWKNPGLEH